MARLLIFLLGNLFRALLGIRRQPLDSLDILGVPRDEKYDEGVGKVRERIDRESHC